MEDKMKIRRQSVKALKRAAEDVVKTHGFSRTFLRALKKIKDAYKTPEGVTKQ